MKSTRIRTTHTGSLPRPEGILALIGHREAGDQVDAAGSEALLGDAVRACVDRQIATGLDVVSDGEFSKPSYATYVKDRLHGFGGEGAFPQPADLGSYPDYAKKILLDRALTSVRTPACVGPVSYRGERAVKQDIDRLRHALRGRAAGFLTAASPGVIALFLKNKHYPNEEAYLSALADAMRFEYRAIHDAGFMLQIDCPDLAMAGHMTYAAESLREVRRHVAARVEALNRAVADIPAEHMRIHVCWGNYEGPHHRDVELKEILDIILSARPAGLSFAAANPRHEHEWATWEKVQIPEYKILIPGVIDTTTNFIEHPELVAERILRFTGIVGDKRVIAGTDCGFATFAGLETVNASIAWGKLDALVEGARLASRTLRHVPEQLSRTAPL